MRQQDRRAKLAAQRQARRSVFEPLESRNMCIVGGSSASTAEFPFAVALLGSSGEQQCGGSLIDSTRVLTAAHCTANARQLTVAVNRTDLQTNSGETIGVAGVQRHPQYNRTTYDNDIAILTLSRPVTQGGFIRPGKHENLNAPGQRATVVGWGAATAYGASTLKLAKVTVPIVSNAQANRPQSYAGSVTSNMLAAGEAGKDSCQGDSGGPLFLRNETGELRQVGIVSWGRGCGLQNFPGVYTRVTNYFDWITQKLSERASLTTGAPGAHPFSRESNESSLETEAASREDSGDDSVFTDYSWLAADSQVEDRWLAPERSDVLHSATDLALGDVEGESRFDPVVSQLSASARQTQDRDSRGVWDASLTSLADESWAQEFRDNRVLSGI